MKLIYDGKELETGGGGGLTEEEADGRYMGRLGGAVQNDNESLSISLDEPDGKVAPEIKLSAAYIGSADQITSKTELMISDEELNMSFEQIWAGEVFASSGIKIGIGDISFFAKGMSVMTVGSEGVKIKKCVTPTNNNMPATKKYVDDAVSGAGIPAGVIVMWSGTASAIPSGWALCNGQNGTPDLRDRFVVGAGSSYAVGAKGGEASHTLTVEEMPRHSHSVSSLSSTSSGSLPVGSGGSRLENSSKTTVATGGGAAHNNMPPYYALCYIMKL